MTTLSDSAVNQRIMSNLVEREVIQCVSSLVHHFATNEAALDGSDYSQEDIIDLCTNRPDHSERIEEIENEISELEDKQSDLEDELSDGEGDRKQEIIEAELATMKSNLSKLESEKDDLESEQEDGHEVYEHWAVTKWFANKLKAHGETVGELFDMQIWGRCTSGQSISIDSVIFEIANDMEILDGQKHSWA